jgi:hypothetical protein
MGEGGDGVFVGGGGKGGNGESTNEYSDVSSEGCSRLDKESEDSDDNEE